MGVTKYRHVEDMPPLPRVSGEDLADRIRAVWARSRRLAPSAYTQGVQKFRDLEAAQQARDQDQQARVRQLRDLRSASPG